MLSEFYLSIVKNYIYKTKMEELKGNIKTFYVGNINKFIISIIHRTFRSKVIKDRRCGKRTTEQMTFNQLD